jgi:hypothetical protein
MKFIELQVRATFRACAHSSAPILRFSTGAIAGVVLRFIERYSEDRERSSNFCSTAVPTFTRFTVLVWVRLPDLVRRIFRRLIWRSGEASVADRGRRFDASY